MVNTFSKCGRISNIHVIIYGISQKRGGGGEFNSGILRYLQPKTGVYKMQSHLDLQTISYSLDFYLRYFFKHYKNELFIDKTFLETGLPFIIYQ